MGFAAAAPNALPAHLQCTSCPSNKQKDLIISGMSCWFLTSPFPNSSLFLPQVSAPQVSENPCPQRGSPQFCIILQDLVSVPSWKSPVADLKHNFFLTGGKQQYCSPLCATTGSSYPLQLRFRNHSHADLQGILVLLFSDLKQKDTGTCAMVSGLHPWVEMSPLHRAGPILAILLRWLAVLQATCRQFC